MENKAHALIAGLFTLLMLLLALLFALWLGRDRVERVPYEMATRLSIPGLNEQAAVRYRGLDVGVVDRISFDPAVPGQILVHMNIAHDTPVTKSTYGMLGYQGVTGIAYIQLDDDGSNPVRLPSSNEHTARIAMRPSLLDQLQDRGLAILIQTEVLAQRLTALLADDNQQTVLAAFANVSSAAREIETIPRSLKPTLHRLPALSEESARTLVALRQLVDQASQLTGQLQAPAGPVARLSSAADQVGDVASQLASEMPPLTTDLRAMLRAVNRTLDNLNERPQGLLFGHGATPPGPGEPGFANPAN